MSNRPCPSSASVASGSTILADPPLSIDERLDRYRARLERDARRPKTEAKYQAKKGEKGQLAWLDKVREDGSADCVHCSWTRLPFHPERARRELKKHYVKKHGFTFDDDKMTWILPEWEIGQADRAVFSYYVASSKRRDDLKADIAEAKLRFEENKAAWARYRTKLAASSLPKRSEIALALSDGTNSLLLGTTSRPGMVSTLMLWRQRVLFEGRAMPGASSDFDWDKLIDRVDNALAGIYETWPSIERPQSGKWPSAMVAKASPLLRPTVRFVQSTVHTDRIHASGLTQSTNRDWWDAATAVTAYAVTLKCASKGNIAQTSEHVEDFITNCEASLAQFLTQCQEYRQPSNAEEPWKECLARTKEQTRGRFAADWLALPADKKRRWNERHDRSKARVRTWRARKKSAQHGAPQEQDETSSSDIDISDDDDEDEDDDDLRTACSGTTATVAASSTSPRLCFQG